MIITILVCRFGLTGQIDVSHLRSTLVTVSILVAQSYYEYHSYVSLLMFFAVGRDLLTSDTVVDDNNFEGLSSSQRAILCPDVRKYPYIWKGMLRHRTHPYHEEISYTIHIHISLYLVYI